MIKVSLMWSVIMSALSDQVINSVIIVSFNVISHYKCDKHQVINSVIIVSLMWPLIISARSDQVINSVIMASLM